MSAQVIHTGPVLPRCSRLTRLELAAARPSLRALLPPEPRNHHSAAEKPDVNPLELARPVSVNALNTQGDSDAALSTSAWSQGKRLAN